MKGCTWPLGSLMVLWKASWVSGSVKALEEDTCLPAKDYLNNHFHFAAWTKTHLSGGTAPWKKATLRHSKKKRDGQYSVSWGSGPTICFFWTCRTVQNHSWQVRGWATLHQLSPDCHLVSLGSSEAWVYPARPVSVHWWIYQGWNLRNCKLLSWTPRYSFRRHSYVPDSCYLRQLPWWREKRALAGWKGPESISKIIDLKIDSSWRKKVDPSKVFRSFTRDN